MNDFEHTFKAGVALLILFFIWWFSDNLLEDMAFAKFNYNLQRWDIEASGWGVILKFSVLIFIAFLFGCFIMYFISNLFVDEKVKQKKFELIEQRKEHEEEVGKIVSEYNEKLYLSKKNTVLKMNALLLEKEESIRKETKELARRQRSLEERKLELHELECLHAKEYEIACNELQKVYQEGINKLNIERKSLNKSKNNAVSAMVRFKNKGKRK